MPDPVRSRRVWIAGQREMPRRADGGQPSESSTLRMDGPARLAWMTVVIALLKVSLIQHQERPHHHFLQHLHWKITQWRLQSQHHMETFLIVQLILSYTDSQHLSLYTDNNKYQLSLIKRLLWSVKTKHITNDTFRVHNSVDSLTLLLDSWSSTVRTVHNIDC